ncbi:TetR/AcrR family transcriptional regulator [Porphyrobacter sp. ULC335]|uniref:TetR/AcrR family transcriptional regulator n=1 Tax=Porphyrobacter sp. ULC335 TaxID=2854260 RepID=UPI00221F417A|nr:TetR/AcrR family transcriptional regulator [Porphyrobacter sp. ULC335]UYV16589.1 TetR/AcrR family transcriptional regulator [Porphyrobacter sp. ULC335]
MNGHLAPQARQTSLKDSLLQNALAILDEAGPDGVTIRAVARASGVSHAAPANHFRDRRDLLTELATAIFGQYLAEVERQHVMHHDRASAYLTSLFNFSQVYPWRYSLLWRKDLIDWEDAKLLTVCEKAYKDFLGALSSRKTSSAPDVTDIETLGTALWSMVHGYSDLRATGFFEARTDSVTGQPRLVAMLRLLLPSCGNDRLPD